MVNDNKWIEQYLTAHYEEVSPKDFYRAIFPQGVLAEKGKPIEGKYNAIAVEIKYKGNNRNTNRYFIHNDLAAIDNIVNSNNFTILAPISYAGKAREAKNAREIFAIAIDIDGLEKESNLRDYFYQQENKIIPQATYTVFSGTGIHAYYVFDEPIKCYPQIAKQLNNLKRDLTRKIWNGYIVGKLDISIQYESLFQGFRAVGSITKGGGRVKAYKTGNTVSIKYLNDFIEKENQVSLEEYKKVNAPYEKVKNQEWFEAWYKKRVIEQQPKGTWKAKEDLYNWWLNRIPTEAKYGHRYFALMVLAIYAKKAGVKRERLEADAFNLVNTLDKLTTDESNHFTNEDVLSALEAYNDNYITFPIDSIVELTNIPITKNKRNGRTQAEHCEYMRVIKDFKLKNKEIKTNGGRKKGSKNKQSKKADIIKQYKADNPKATITDCCLSTGISRTTIYKYWNSDEV